MKHLNQNSVCKSKLSRVKFKKLLSGLCTAMTALMMTACSNSTHLSPVVPANLLEPCPDLQKLESGQGKVALVWSIDVVAKYNDCKARHSAIIKALK
jgi:hypothetical protein